jgi:hypothetical protein
MNLRREYADVLVANVEDTTYPSQEIMNRVEAALTDRDQAERYGRILLEKVQSTRYPSLQMLDRIQRLADRLG